MTNVEVVRKGNRVGVNRDGKPVGHATKIPGRKPELWTAHVYIKQAPFDVARTGFGSADDAADFIARNGSTPEHLER